MRLLRIILIILLFIPSFLIMCYELSLEWGRDMADAIRESIQD